VCAAGVGGELLGKTLNPGSPPPPFHPFSSLHPFYSFFIKKVTLGADVTFSTMCTGIPSIQYT